MTRKPGVKVRKFHRIIFLYLLLLLLFSGGQGEGSEGVSFIFTVKLCHLSQLFLRNGAVGDELFLFW